jgi:hypothetical protein
MHGDKSGPSRSKNLTAILTAKPMVRDGRTRMRRHEKPYLFNIATRCDTQRTATRPIRNQQVRGSNPRASFRFSRRGAADKGAFAFDTLGAGRFF